MRRARSIKVSGGLNCKKCNKKMQRYNHPEGWEPKPDQDYWFTYYDKCNHCGMWQMYEEAKVYREPFGWVK